MRLLIVTFFYLFSISAFAEFEKKDSMVYFVEGDKKCHLGVYLDTANQKIMVYLSDKSTERNFNLIKENGKRNYIVYSKKELLPFLPAHQLEIFSINDVSFKVGEDRADIRFSALVEGLNKKEHFVKNFKDDVFFSKRSKKTCLSK